jgi:plastocyanin
MYSGSLTVPPTTATFDFLFNWYLVSAIIAGGFVIGLLIFFAVKYRASEGAPPPSKGPESLWVVLAVVLIMAGALGAALAVPLQPPLAGGSTSCSPGVACIRMPVNAAAINFSPDNITIVLGVNNTVQWTNQDAVTHTVVVCPAGGGQLCSPSAAVAYSSLLSRGDTFEVTLNATGSITSTAQYTRLQ